MPPSTDACTICSRVFYGRQKFLRCSDCKLRAHTKCVCWPDNVDTFLQSGVSSFLCESCAIVGGAARLNSDGVVGNHDSDAADFSRTLPALSPARQLPAGPPASSPPVDLGAGVESLRSLLLDAMEGISFLTDEVAALRDENARLRHEQKRDAELQAGAMALLRTEVRGLRDALGQRRKPDAPDRRRQPVDGAAGGSLGKDSYAAALHSSLPQASPTKIVAATLPSDGQNNAPPKDDIPPSGINSARPKARTPALIGASETCKLIVAPPSTRRRALFVTKLNPDTSCEDISLQAHIQGRGPVRELVCTRLKTRLRAHTKCVCWPVDVREFLQSGVPSFTCASCEKISGGASPNHAAMASNDHRNVAPLSHFSVSPSPTDAARPDKGERSLPSSPYIGNTGVDSLRALLLDALEGISFLTDQVAALRDENAQLRREHKHDAQQQAATLHNIQAELRSFRHEPKQGGKKPPSSYAAAASLQDPVGLIRDQRGNTGPVTEATCASGAAAPAAIGGERSVASILDSRTHPRHQDKLNQDGGGFRETRPKLPRTRRPLLKGSASASGIPVAPPPSQPRRQRAVFVTRLGPNCDAPSLQAHIEQGGTLRLAVLLLRHCCRACIIAADRRLKTLTQHSSTGAKPSWLIASVIRATGLDAYNS
ncbi:hypothetical protein ISCGN_010989 [Ixodes scapularis]